MPLIEGQDLAQIEVHQRGFPLYSSSGCKHLVHLRLHLTIVRNIGIEQSLQFEVLLFHLSHVIDQLHAMVKKNLVEAHYLVIAELQLRSSLRVFPPLARIARPGAHDEALGHDRACRGLAARGILLGACQARQQ